MRNQSPPTERSLLTLRESKKCRNQRAAKGCNGREGAKGLIFLALGNDGHQQAPAENESKSLSSRHTERSRIVFDSGLLSFGLVKAPISPGLSSAPPAVPQSGKFRLGTWTYDAILSGHRANEVANRQDADPMHFVSSVLIHLVCRAVCQTHKSPLREGFCVSGGWLLFSGRR